MGGPPRETSRSGDRAPPSPYHPLGSALAPTTEISPLVSDISLSGLHARRLLLLASSSSSRKQKGRAFACFYSCMSL